MINPTTPKPSRHDLFSQAALPTLFTLLFSVIWTHALAAILRTASGLAFETTAPYSGLLAWSALVVGVAAIWKQAVRWRQVAIPVAVAFLVLIAVAAWTPQLVVPALALPVVAVGAALLNMVLRRRTPEEFVEALRSSGAKRILWGLVALLAVLQFARLSTYVSNPESNWFLTTSHPFYAKHECANAYVYAAELDDRGEPDIYDPAHYPGLNPKAEPHSNMKGLAPEDPFQYPPTFLLLPKLAMAITNDYPAIRSVWFALNATFCIASVFLLSWWLGRGRRALPLLLMPVLLISFPVLHNFQYGQFHFAAIALAISGMVALDSKRKYLGAAFLAAAISAKVFPVFLLFMMLGQRRHRDIFRVASFGLLFAALGFFVLGPRPYFAFFGAHVPRLSSGAAFAFGDAWPEIADLVIAGNQGVAGTVDKLHSLGFHHLDGGWAAGASRWYSLILLLGLWLLGRHVDGATRTEKAGLWLGGLGLASLASTGAWGDYVPLTAVWALVMILPLSQAASFRIGLIAAGLFQVLLLGTVPLGSHTEGWWMIPVSLVGSFGLFFIFVAAACTPIWTASRLHPARDTLSG